MLNHNNIENRFWLIVCTIAIILFVLPGIVLSQTRIKDIAKVKGLESRYITGISIVNGLRGTGDGTQVSILPLAISNILKNFGQTIDPTTLRTRNAAYVLVNTDIPPFAKRGALIDVTVSSLGDATSLEGGVLQNAILLDVQNNQIVAEAQGPITIGGLNQQGVGRQNFTTTGKVINGARILQDIETSFVSDGKNITLVLNYPDFTTAQRIVEVVNGEFGAGAAKAIDPATIEIEIVNRPQAAGTAVNPIEFISIVEQLTVDVDIPAVVVINERTGTVIAGGNVKISPVLISHGDLTIQIRPPAGQAAQAAQQGRVVYFDEKTGSSVEDLAAALNALQVTPRDLITIFENLKAQGALKAVLKIN
jgi:flagellar P-ring protein precursor FlgI